MKKMNALIVYFFIDMSLGLLSEATDTLEKNMKMR